MNYLNYFYCQKDIRLFKPLLFVAVLIDILIVNLIFNGHEWDLDDDLV